MRGVFAGELCFHLSCSMLVDDFLNPFSSTYAISEIKKNVQEIRIPPRLCSLKPFIFPQQRRPSQASRCAGPREAVSTPHSSLLPSDVPRTNGGGDVGPCPIGQLRKRGFSACALGQGLESRRRQRCHRADQNLPSLSPSCRRRFGAESGLRGLPFEAKKLIFFLSFFLIFLPDTSCRPRSSPA